MNRIKFVIVLLLGALIVGGIAWAQTNGGYTCGTVSVNSASVPVEVLPDQEMTTFLVNERAANASATPAAANILVFPYRGTVPTGVPSACASPSTTWTATGCNEVTPTKPFSDGVGCDAPTCKDAIGQSWAAVLESGSTAVTVDSCFR